MKPLTTIDWRNAHGYIEILQPFHKATKIEESETDLTLPSVIPVISILYDKTKAYIANRAHAGFGIGFARAMLASIDDRFGKFPRFLLMKPHCLATFSDPRFSGLYFVKKPYMDEIRETVIEWAKDEIEVLQTKEQARETVSSPAPTVSKPDTFWGDFDELLEKSQTEINYSVDTEINCWSGISAPSRSSDPAHVMEGMKRDFPRMYLLFRKFSVFPSTQNKDERLFSMVGRNTGPLCRSIKVNNLEK